ncbi:MAG: histidinol-phosphate transaminase [Gemmatimonadetes bacterium]|nr:histidinol-phosphate transaminase [Gemmatimonadota bacterium]MYK98908.1 histidinol-phosphate transaminase [Gemmatimonadota bacterium]
MDQKLRNADAPGVKSAVRAMSGYTLVQPDCPVKLNQNECPFDVPAELKREIVDEALASNWGRYPSFVPGEVKAAIGERHGLGPEHVLIGNGSNELIQSIFQAAVSTGDAVVLPAPTFTLYALMGRISGAEIRTVHLKRDLSFDVDRLEEESAQSDVRLVVLCSPNNPTGSMISPEDTARIADATAGLVVVDEAYFEFVGVSCIELLERHPNLVITRTFSKALGAAGLRLGYLVADPAVARELEKVKLPYNVNIISLIAARKLIGQDALIEERASMIRSERQRVFEALRGLPGIKPHPSHANFILFEAERPVAGIFHGLIERGVLIRDVSRYPILERGMRVTIGLPEENDAFLEALREVLATQD